MIANNRYVRASKELGWEARGVVYPSLAEVEKAVTEHDCYRLLQWNRFLGSPMSNEHLVVINKVVEGLKSAREWAEAHPEE